MVSGLSLSLDLFLDGEGDGTRLSRDRDRDLSRLRPPGDLERVRARGSSTRREDDIMRGKAARERCVQVAEL